MKVSSRIISGYALLIVLTVGVLAYQVYLIRQLQTINGEMSGVRVESSLTGINLLYHQGLFEEFALKYFGSGDAQYQRQFHDVADDIAADLKKLRTSARSDPEQKAIERFSKSWQAVVTLTNTEKPAETRELSPRLRTQLGAMRADAEFVLNATQAAILDSAQRSAATAAYGVSVSRWAAAVALLLSVLVAAPIVWSIVSRMRSLARATRLVAAGQFDHRLPVTGSDEFADLAQDFNAMARRLGELDQMKKDFVSHVSHDLKGPLASMRETVHLLLEEIPGPLNEKQRRVLSLCLKSSERLSAMIGNLLDVSRMEAGMVEYKKAPVDLVLLSRNTSAEFEGLAREKKIELVVESLEPEIWVECDSGRMAQVIGNLLENAIKFSPPSGAVRFRNETSGAHVLMSVLDRGPGVPKESRAKIFERFHQVNPGKKVAGQSVGLGLAICRTIVEAHGGKIWVEDNPEGGSIFYVKIPLSEMLQRSST